MSTRSRDGRRRPGIREPGSCTGFAIVPAAVIATRDVACIAVYAALAQRANPERRSWPAVETIAATIGVSKPTVIKALRKLADAGLIVVQVRSQRGSITRHEYLLTERSPVNDVDRSGADDEAIDASVSGATGQPESPVDRDDRSTSLTGTGQPDLPEEEIDRSTRLTGAGKGDLPAPVNDVDQNNTQVNKTQENKTQTVTADAVTAPPAPAPTPPEPTKAGKTRTARRTQTEAEQLAFALIDAFARGSSRQPKDVAGRERYDARKAFEPLVDRYSADDVEACTAYLRTDPFWQRGNLSAVHVAKALPDWVAQGRPVQRIERSPAVDTYNGSPLYKRDGSPTAAYFAREAERLRAQEQEIP